MKTNFFYFTNFIFLIVIVNFQCIMKDESPKEYPSSEDIVRKNLFGETDRYDYLLFDNDRLYCCDNSNDILVCGSGNKLNIINKYSFLSDNIDLLGCSILGMTKFNDAFVITTKNNLNNTNMIITTTNFDSFKTYQIDLSADAVLYKGLKYYKNEDCFIGLIEIKGNNEVFYNIINFVHDSSSDTFSSDENIKGIISKNINYFNIYENSLWFSKFDKDEIYWESYYVYYDIYEYDLISHSIIKTIKYCRHSENLKDVFFFDDYYIWLLSDYNTVYQSKKWW